MLSAYFYQCRSRTLTCSIMTVWYTSSTLPLFGEGSVKHGTVERVTRLTVMGHFQTIYLVLPHALLTARSLAPRTPLHCSSSCNDRQLCEFLVRNGAALMAMTESDGATASQKCDPYAVGFEECENFLKGEAITPTRTFHTHTHNTVMDPVSILINDNSMPNLHFWQVGRFF